MSTPVTLDNLAALKAQREPIVSLTAYDAGFARLAEAAGIEVVLVGDSLGMVLHGEADTLGVTMADMAYHTRLVRRGLTDTLLVADLPYQSYTSAGQALANARQLVAAGADVVKLEGGAVMVDTVVQLSRAGIAVCGHLGLQPQSIRELGGFRIQGRDSESAARIHADAVALEEAGAQLLVLECVPPQLAADIRAAVRMPVIGIGAGGDCDGQVLVLQDVLGISEYQPRFARNFLTGRDSIQAALAAYVAAVKAREFPPPAAD
ncbi:3-methyl-2-oxobutanoate hydroxymethyltransferase [Methylohalomonas lacus]|uniref:3-methyl-2-oxobutanoate hydroxymethyltransferase n=1 Tax=Methylohalomonas lacus TaxID=398773 RepID=A0AAE3HJ81_9GAMM|nr:3-methyl-2-oxobutanoate hydroxymethyltransferase [Methylohalomonas lacus]MCS3902178.1 3-methyl-2-oxobutanoate hydroxymethyltransferase [Methylohalomonas lacus]